MAEYFVERQYWMHWPKVLLMCRKRDGGIERRRYVPDKGMCHDVALEGEWFECSTCGCVRRLLHPHYCPNCGRKVVGE